MVGILTIGMTTPARADLEIAISTTNDPPAIPLNVVATAPSGTFVQYSNANFGGFDISLFGSSLSPGAPNTTALGGFFSHITNDNLSTATLYITLGDTNFTTQTAPPDLLVGSHIFANVLIPNSNNLLTYSSYINADNSQNGTSGMTSGVQSLPVTSGTPSDDVVFTITSLPMPYSVTERFALTLGAGAEILVSSDTSSPSHAVTPEPSTMGLITIGMLGLTGYGLRRRRRG
jgi:hypothetical protein